MFLHRICQIVLVFNLQQHVSLHTFGELVYAKDGDLILGGLFPMHNYDVQTQTCAGIREPRALKTVESMNWVIEKINNDSTLLPNYTLGFEIYDTCFYDIWTLRQSINFLPAERAPKESCSCTSDNVISQPPEYFEQCNATTKNIIGVIGAARSAASIQAATLLGLHKIPQISFLSTSDELSSRFAYPYFFRVVPPDRQQVRVIIDIILHYGWTYVSFLYSDDDYGRNGNSEFTLQAKRAGICIAWTQEISDYFTGAEMDKVVANLRSEPHDKAVAVVLFMHLEEGVLLFESILKAGAEDEFTWLASDGIGSLGLQGLIGVEGAALGTLSVIPFSERLGEYDQYILTDGLLNMNNPWLEEYIDVYTNCTINGFCGNSTSPTDTLVMDSVYAFAHALDSLISDHCESELPCAVLSDGELLRDYLYDVSFESLVNGKVEFNEFGESYGKYAVNNIISDKLWGYQEIRVGEWNAQNESPLVITDILVRFYTNETQGRPWQVPESTCSTPCGAGYAKRIFHDYPCCWECVKCEEGEAIINETQCVACELPEWPNENLTECVIQEPVYMSWNRWDGAILMVLSSVAILLALASTVVYLINFKHPFICNSDPVSTLFIMLGILTSLSACVLVAIPPTVEICYLVRLLPGIGLALMFYPFCLKCVRLYRIFRHAKKTESTEEAKLLNAQRQVLVILTGLALQLIISAMLVLWIQPTIVLTMTESQLHVSCNVAYLEVLSEAVIYFSVNVMSIVCSTSARTLPDNNYEARTANFAAFSTAVTMSSFYLIYLALYEPYQKLFYRFLGFIITDILYIFCIFVVKCYSVYFVPVVDLETKERKGTLRSRSRTNTSSSGAKRRIDSMHRGNSFINTDQRIRSISGMTDTQSSYPKEGKDNVNSMNYPTVSYDSKYSNCNTNSVEGLDEDTYM